MKTSLLCLTIFALSAAPAHLHAEEWSYAACVDYARAHNISLKQSRLAEETAAYNLAESRGAWEPTMDVGTTQGVSNYPLATGNKVAYNSNYALNAGWTVWNGGRRERTIDRDKLQLEIERLNTSALSRSIETELLQAYLNILYARESIDIYESAVALSEAQADRARQLMEAGRISRVDYSQFDAQLQQDRYELVNARGAYDTRRMELKQLLELGIDTDLTLMPVSITDSELLSPLPPLEESFRLALETDVQLRALEMAKQTSALDVKIAKADRMPKITLAGGIGVAYYAPGSPFGTALRNSFGENLGVTLSLPILDGKKTSMAVARAKVQELGSQLDIDRRHTDLAQQVESWYIEARSSRSRYEAAQQQLSSASLTNELTNEQFRLGLVNTIDLMTAHDDLINARHSLLQAKYMTLLALKMIQYYREAAITLN